jgi:hypothetical protein
MSACRLLLAGYLLLWPALLAAQTNSPAAPSEWERTVDLAKKEAGVVVSVPSSAELRKEFETGFQKAFPGIDLELNVARGAGNINKIVEEQNAGVRNVDLHIGGTTSIVTGLLALNLLDPVMPAMLLAEV